MEIVIVSYFSEDHKRFIVTCSTFGLSEISTDRIKTAREFQKQILEITNEKVRIIHYKSDIGKKIVLQ